MNEEIIVEARALKTYFPLRTGLFGGAAGMVRAVDGVSFAIPKGTTMSLVGESGCGKTTVGRTLLRLCAKTSGETLFQGREVFDLSHEALRRLRPKMQMIFQDPYSSLSPRMPAGEIIGEAVREHGIVPKAELEDYISHIMLACGLEPYLRQRYAHEFSGGQRQRVCIARALALKPAFIVCDEPVSALDVSIQAQIVNLLEDLQAEFGLTYLFISHDLAVVEHISDQVGVMYLGELVEVAATGELFANPLHPYTQALLSAIPVQSPTQKRSRIILEGSIPSPANPPQGCRFHTRCRYCMPVCRERAPEKTDAGGGHIVACHLYGGNA